MTELRKRGDACMSRRVFMSSTLGVAIGAVFAVRVAAAKGPIVASAALAPFDRLTQSKASSCSWAGGATTVYKYDSGAGTIYEYDAQSKLARRWDGSPRRLIYQSPTGWGEQPPLPFGDSEELRGVKGVAG